jgi:hypothetical protein
MLSTLFCLHLLTALSAPQITPGDVMGFFSRIPATQEGDERRLGHWDRRPSALAAAAAIARHASSREVAARLAVYATLESGLNLKARGDRGHALGLLQLHNVTESLAFDPDQAIPWWLRLASQMQRLCAMNPPRERLAGLASGRCNRGRKLVARREDIVDLVLGRRAPGEAFLGEEEEAEAFGRE